MGRALLAISGTAAGLLPRPIAQLGFAVSTFWHELARQMFNPYRPELHYMRGPGPAWRAKYGSLPPAE